MAGLDRRQLLAGGLRAAAALGAVAAPGSALRLLRAPGGGGRRALVVVQLSGGNDGLNTLVPLGNDDYRRARKRLALKPRDVLRIEEGRGLHPSLASVRRLYDEGRVALVEGVGYPEPSRSHFRCLDIWHTASVAGTRDRGGWLGKVAEALAPGRPTPNQVVHVGREAPYSLHSTTHPPVAFTNPAAYRWVGNEADLAAYGAGEAAEGPGDALDFVRSVMQDARDSSVDVRRAVATRRPRVEYPRGKLADALRAVAALLDGDVGVRIASVELSGFDTHASQLGTQERLLRELDGALAAFLADLDGTEAGRHTAVLVWSEFGRRVAENASGGTDHGTAAPVLLLGEPVRGGLHGAPPRLDRLDDRGDLVFTTDFRSVYATLVERWFGLEPEAVLGASFPTLDLV